MLSIVSSLHADEPASMFKAGYSNLEITAGTQMRDAGIELARQLRAGAVPMPAKAPPFKGEPWSYGNVRQELD